MAFLTASKNVILKKQVKPSIYITAIKELPAEIRTRLLKLGGLYAILVVFISFISSQFIDIDKIMPLVNGGDFTNPDLIKEMYFAMIIAAILYFPLAMMMWFSPQLIAWQNLTIGKALFGSWMGFWLNKGPFLVYLSTWGIILIALPLFLGGIFESLNLKQYGGYLITPLSMLAVTVLYCSFYAVWKGCFIQATPNTLDTNNISNE